MEMKMKKKIHVTVIWIKNALYIQRKSININMAENVAAVQPPRAVRQSSTCVTYSAKLARDPVSRFNLSYCCLKYYYRQGYYRTAEMDRCCRHVFRD